MKQLFTFFIVLFSLSASANDIQVSNVSLESDGSGGQLITFDVSWKNSWRTGNDIHDGAWIFAKFRKSNTPGQPWQHVTLLQKGNTSSTGATLEVTKDNVGAFIYRASNGSGTVNFTKNKLAWDTETDIVGDGESIEVKVFALEMVYIPQGSFYLGSSGNETWHYYDGNTTNAPYFVKNENEVTIGSDIKIYNYSMQRDVPKLFPKGYASFWCMKHEISEQHFIDFINHIDENYATSVINYIRTDTEGPFGNSSYYTQNITGSWPEYEAVHPTRAMGDLWKTVFMNIARWSGLRPMSEFEFEKASRGAGVIPTPDEFVWGTEVREFLKESDITNRGKEDESINPSSIANVSRLTPAIRVGLMARPNNSTRELSGATYYGVLNMGDNVKERVVRAYGFSNTKSTFSREEHGLGQYTFDNINSDHFNEAVLYDRGGGFFNSNNTWSQISSRSSAESINNSEEDKKLADYGGRFVRTAD